MCIRDSPQILRNKFHKVYYIFRFSFKTFTQFRILGRHTYRAGIQIAYTHHDASHSHQRSCRKTELLCAQHGCNGHISAAHKLTVSLDTDFISQTV